MYFYKFSFVIIQNKNKDTDKAGRKFKKTIEQLAGSWWKLTDDCGINRTDS